MWKGRRVALVPFQSPSVSPSTSPPSIEETKSEQKEVVIALTELKSIAENIKDDTKRHDQGKNDLMIDSREIKDKRTGFLYRHNVAHEPHKVKEE